MSLSTTGTTSPVFNIVPIRVDLDYVNGRLLYLVPFGSFQSQRRVEQSRVVDTVVVTVLNKNDTSEHLQRYLYEDTP